MPFAKLKIAWAVLVAAGLGAANVVHCANPLLAQTRTALAFKASGEVLERRTGETMTAVEMNVGDTLRFTLATGETRTLVVEEVDARVLLSNLATRKKGFHGGGTIYVMTCRVRIDGHPLTIRRYVPDAQSFAEPLMVNGMRLWLDGTRPVERFLNANHASGDEKVGGGVPRKDARFAIQDATRPLCPQELRPWYPNPDNVIDVAKCYNADDVWMGPYQGADLHGGLDINMPIGTPLWAPIDFDDQFYFHSLRTGQNNNRWRGVRTWPNGQRWVLQAHHMVKLRVAEKEPLKQGTHYAEAAGVLTGSHAHSHFTFKIGPENDEVMLDPWLLFWETFENNKRRAGAIRASIAPLAPSTTGQAVRFLPTGSRAGTTGNTLSYHWSFGDSCVSRDAEPAHVFARAGVYPVTLVVEDGTERASTTHHLTVNGNPVEQPVLVLESPHEPWFQTRPAGLMDVSGVAVRGLPHTLEFRARPKSSPQPAPRTVRLRNTGGGSLAAPSVNISYEEGEGWLSVTPSAESLEVAVNGERLVDRHGRYRARVTVTCAGAINSPQTFGVHLEVSQDAPRSAVVVDDLDPACIATPGFWLRPRFSDHVPNLWTRGHAGTYLASGDGTVPGAVVRFTPDLAAGSYAVSLHESTPFQPWKGAPEDVRFAVRVCHRRGTDTVWVEPLKDRSIGTFEFAEGKDGYVEIVAQGARGIVVVDAVRFDRK